MFSILRRDLLASRSPLSRHSLRQLRRSSSETPQATSRIARIESRLPKFLRRYIQPLRTAPLSHITAFLILHELTAIIPLFGLTGAFHYYNWLPPYISEGKWVSDGTEKFGKWMRKKGWINDEERSGRYFGRGEAGMRIVVELATAYAVTKMLLPLRLVGSVWATPWFARWTVLPVTRRVGGWFGRGKGKGGVVKGGDAAGTGAVGGGVVSKGK